MAKKNAAEPNYINDLIAWISEGRHVGFAFAGRSYSIGYGNYADGQGFISLSELGVEPPLGCFIDLDEFLAYAQVQGNILSKIWPIVTDVRFFVPEDAAPEAQ